MQKTTDTSRTIVMFPGQGSQQPGMGETLFKTFPNETAQANKLLGYDVTSLCLDPAQQAKLNQTRYTQPLLFFVNALSEQERLKTGGTTAELYIGHSLGEYNALQASGVFSFMEGLALVNKRALAMEAAAKTTAGGMLAVLGIEQTVIAQTISKAGMETKVFIANFNAPTQIILSGEKAALEQLSPALSAAGARRCVMLPVSGAFHSPMMQSAATIMQEVLTAAVLNPPQVPVYANLNAQPYAKDKTSIIATLSAQLTQQVRWSETITALRALSGESTFIEVGPGKVLSGLLKRI